MASVFTKIVQGELPSYKIAENENFYAFLDINPLVEGHTLVVPKQEIDDFFELSDDLLAEMMVFAKPIARALKKVFGTEKVAVIVLGLEVRHAHLHLGPINKEKDMNFYNPKLTLSEEEFQEIAGKIRAHLE